MLYTKLFSRCFSPRHKWRLLTTVQSVTQLVGAITLFYVFLTFTSHTGQLKRPWISSSPGFKEPYFAENNETAQILYGKVRVLCWVLTGPASHEIKAKHIKATWGQRCNVLLFISSEYDEDLPTVQVAIEEGRETLWSKTRQAFRYVWDNHRDQADWFLKADDDTYVVLENLRYLLSAYDTADPVYLGHKFKRYVESGYMQGGAGYVLSKESLRRFATIGLNDPDLCRSDPGGSEDVEMGQCMENLGVKGIDTRDSYGRNRFLPFGAETHLNPGPVTKDWWLWTYIYYPMKGGLDCCSDTVISFHYINPKDMYMLDYLIYHVQPYGVTDDRSRIQQTPAPPPDNQLTEKPWIGPTAEDERYMENYRETVKQLKFKTDMLKKKADKLDKMRLRTSTTKPARRKVKTRRLFTET